MHNQIVQTRQILELSLIGVAKFYDRFVQNLGFLVLDTTKEMRASKDLNPGIRISLWDSKTQTSQRMLTSFRYGKKRRSLKHRAESRDKNSTGLTHHRGSRI